MARRLEQHEKYEYEHLLGLTGTYDKKSLKKAYLKCVREWHPDLAAKNGHTDEEASEMTKKINNAFVELSGLLHDSTDTVACETSPTTTSSRGTSASTGPATSTAGNATGHSPYGTTSAYGTSPRATATAGTRDGKTATAAGTGNTYTTVPDEGSSEPQPRGAVPRNMAAAMRYTRIVTSSTFVKWFVAGLGPHIMFALASLVLLVLLGVCISGLYGLGGIVLMVRLLPFAIIYDVITGKGAEMVSSLADIWAVNKAVNSTE